MYKVGVGTDGPHAQIKFLKQEIKQERFQSKFEIVLQLKILIFISFCTTGRQLLNRILVMSATFLSMTITLLKEHKS